MKKTFKSIILLLFIPIILSVIPAGCQDSPPGSLVIGGGGLKDATASVWEQYVSLAGGKEAAAIAVIPSGIFILPCDNKPHNQLLQYANLPKTRPHVHIN